MRTGSDRTPRDGDESLRPRGWAGKLWSPAIGAEHRACRETAAIFDESSFAKILVSGEGGADLLERLCANRVARDVGQVTYTQMLNPRGGIECDFTVTRFGPDRFRIVTGTAFGQHDLAWIRQHLPDDGSVQVSDETSMHACFGVWGPRARDILQPLTTADLSNEAFPYMRARELAIGRVPCLALRVTYVGELGWELYCRAEFGLALWDTIWEAGRAHGLVAGGYTAIDSLRLEKGYRVWGADITPEDSPFEAGLGFAVKLDKSDFIGREALAAAPPPARLLRCLTLEDPRAVALGSEPVRIGNDLVGPGDERRVRLHGRALDRLRVRALGARARHRGRGRDLRRMGARGRRRGAAVRSRGGEDPGVSDLQAAVERVWPGRGARDRGARRRDHEPQLQGRRSTAATYVLRDRRAATPSCSGSTAPSSTRRRCAAAAVGVGPEVVASSSPRATSSRGSSRARSSRSSAMREPETLARVRGRCAASTTARRSRRVSTRSASSRRYRETALAHGGDVPAAYERAHGDRRPDRARTEPAPRPSRATTTS